MDTWDIYITNIVSTSNLHFCLRSTKTVFNYNVEIVEAVTDTTRSIIWKQVQ
jgi:hypothetical protein